MYEGHERVHQGRIVLLWWQEDSLFLRYSTVTFGKEFPDSGRNPRGFAIKHYTEDGNYDVVGLNWVSFPPLLL